MTESELLSWCRLYIPEINSTDVISDANLLIILNLACSEFINKTDALPTSVTFNLVQDLATYPISTYISTFGKIRKEGLWLYNSQTSKWKQLDPYTTERLNQDFPSWLNVSSSLPARYVVEGDELIITPPSSSTYAGSNYLKMFYYKRSVDMSSSSHYPFSGSATRYPHLADYEEAVVDYVRFKIKQMLKKNADAEEAKNTFYTKCAYIKQALLYRPDLISGVRAVGAGNLTHHKEAFKS